MERYMVDSLISISYRKRKEIRKEVGKDDKTRTRKREKEREAEEKKERDM